MPSKKFPNELYNERTLFSLGGASAGVWIFTMVLGNVFNIEMINYKWAGLMVALFLSFIGALSLHENNIKHYTLAFFNGLLIYVTASGIDSINQGAPTHKKNVSKTTISTILPFTSEKIWWTPQELRDSIIYYKAVVEKNSQKILQYEKKIKIIVDSCQHKTQSENAFDSPQNNSSNCNELLKQFNLELTANKQLKSNVDSLKKSIGPNSSELLKQLNMELAANRQLKGKVDSLNKVVTQNKNKAKSVSSQTSEVNKALNFEITEANKEILGNTLDLSRNLQKSIHDFYGSGAFSTRTGSVVFLQKDIYALEKYLKTNIDQIDLLLKSQKNN